MAVYVKYSIEVQKLNTMRYDGNEYIFLQLNFNGRVVQLVALYRKPGSYKTQFLKDVDKLASYLNLENTVLVIGDFNYEIHSNVDLKLRMKTLCNMQYIETDATFQNTTGATSIIVSAYTNGHYMSSVIECPYSDHKIVAGE